jgi:hypothetical protein
VLVDGFHAISVSGARRSGAPGSIRDLLYHVGWVRTPLSEPTDHQPMPLKKLSEVARAALDEVVAMRGFDKLQSAIVAGENLAASFLARGLREMGVGEGGKNTAFDADSLGVAPEMRLAFDRYVTSLTERQLLQMTGDEYIPTDAFAAAADSVEDQLKTYVSSCPGHLAESQLVTATSAELGPILRGEKDAVQVLFAGLPDMEPNCWINSTAMAFSPAIGWPPSPPPWARLRESFPKVGACASSK